MTGHGEDLSWRRLTQAITALVSSVPSPLGGVIFQPDPYTIGDPKRGQDLTEGRYQFPGFQIEAPRQGLFDLPAQGAAVERAIHGFHWLDDLAAFGSAQARSCARAWVLDWQKRYPAGRGAKGGYDLIGRRLLRLLLHAEFVFSDLTEDEERVLIRSIARQAVQLRRGWKKAPQGRPRFEALTGLLFAALCVDGLDSFLTGARQALADECLDYVGQDGAIPSRSPEELLEIFSLLTWVTQGLSEGQIAPPQEIGDTIARIAPTLRALRHADGGLARFHGGGRGTEGWLDYGLAQAGVRDLLGGALSMGYARLASLRTTVIVDAAKPPTGGVSGTAHASTLAFELTSGRRPIVVSNGSGASLGEEWQKAGRATQAHSTVLVGGASSTDFGPTRKIAGRKVDTLSGGPSHVSAELYESELGKGLECWHDGYLRRFGLVHSRQMALSSNGRILAGEDTLAAISDSDKQRFTAASGGPQGLAVAVHFHLHPDVDVITGPDGSVVTLALASGENWVFRHDGHLTLTVASSLYYDRSRFRPVESKQLILQGRMLNPAVQVNWSLAKAEETAQGIRDLVRDGVSLND